MENNQDDEQLREWPIYALINYDNSGHLIDLCRAHLDLAANKCSSAKQAASNNCTTSGYQTIDELPNRHTGRGRRRDARPQNRSPKQRNLADDDDDDDGRSRAPKLEWRHLIERSAPLVAQQHNNGDNTDDDSLARPYRFQVRELCAAICRLVGPFVSNELHVNNQRAHQVASADCRRRRRQLAAPLEQLEAGGLLAKGRDSQAARLRRLSWRRRRLAAAGQTRPKATTAAAAHDDDDDDELREQLRHNRTLDLPEQPAAAAKRHLLGVPNRTFSLDDASGSNMQLESKRHDDLTSELDERNQTRLDRWLADLELRQPTNQSNQKPLPANKSRGRYGETIVHVLLINHTNESLIAALLMLKLWPGLLFDVFESDKFAQLNCLHLTISHANSQLLEHLVKLAQLEGGASEAAKRLIEQRVSGSLFRPPSSDNLKTALGLKEPIRQSRQLQTSSWCDKLEHWPTANGTRHSILLDRFNKLRARAAKANHSSGGGGGGDSPTSSSSSSSTVYLGQTPLQWSVCFESRQMFELLLELGQASVNSVDESGNNCLHQLVINDQRQWTRFLIKHGASLKARNSLALSPFLFACQLGRCELFVEFLELTAVEFWCYSSVRCCGYPLTDLDSIILKSSSSSSASSSSSSSGNHHDHDQHQHQSAVSIILESQQSSNEEKSALLSTNVVKKLLEEKWKIFARRLFYRDLILLLVQLILMIVASLLRPARYVKSPTTTTTRGDDDRSTMSTTNRSASSWFEPATWRRHSANTDGHWSWSGAMELVGLSWSSLNERRVLRHACELATVGLALDQLWRFGAEWLRYRSLRLQLTYNPLAGNAVIANALLIACLPLRLLGLLEMRGGPVGSESLVVFLNQLEDILLVVASPLLWSSLLFFVAAFYVTGPFVAMINYMLMRDLRQFSLIYLIFLYAFAQCIFFVNYNKQAQVTGDTLMPRTDLTTSSSSSSGNGTSPNATSKSEYEATLEWLAKLSAKYVDLWLELFQMTLGVYEFQPYRHSILSRVFLMLFMHLIPILFNMLIAMMNNTYSLIISQSERAWSFQWAKTLFALERRLNDDERLFYLKKYAINLSNSIKKPEEDSQSHDEVVRGENGESKLEEEEEEEQFVPGLMIIKQTHCTRAEMRRKLVGYWQMSIRQVLDEMRRRRAEMVAANC